MKLRNQLLLISLLTLLIPWGGYLFIQELEQTLRHQQLKNLSQHAELVAKQINSHKFNAAPNKPHTYESIYAFTLPSPIILDGYFDDWRSVSQQTIPLEKTKDAFSARYLAGINGDRFYLFIAVTNKNTRYRNPSKRDLTNNDHLLLKLALPTGGITELIASPIAPGPLDLLSRSGSRHFIKDSTLRGYWQDTQDGYQIELEIPLSRVNQGLGFSIIKAPSVTTEKQWSGITSPEENRVLAPVIYRQHTLESLLAPYQQNHTRISVLNKDTWVIAQLGKANEEQFSSPWQQGEYKSLARDILLSLFKAVLGTSQPKDIEEKTKPGQRSNAIIKAALDNKASSNWFTDPDSKQAIIAAAYPITLNSNQPNLVQSVVLVEQTTEAIASLSDRAMVKLIAISFSVVLIIIMVLLGFASLLSWRVTHLRNHIEDSISEDGRMGQFYEPSNAQDELGDLSRSFASMHKEVSSYTEYLEGFSKKLSHELKTPLAIVRSSLENISMLSNSTELNTYLHRADNGAKRLSLILQSMSEASRLEKSIASTEKEEFDLTEVVSGTGKAFQSMLTEHRLSLNIEQGFKKVLGSPELIAQLLDKLIENARDFTPKNGTISIELNTRSGDYCLRVSNEGSLLPIKMKRDIFNSFVSVRGGDQKEGHMGQGLVIVKLITDYHKGRVTAFNLENKSGVCFDVRLPKDSN